MFEIMSGDERFFIEDLTNNGCRYEETLEAALKCVHFLVNKMSAIKVRMTDRKAGTYTEFFVPQMQQAVNQ